MLLTHRPATANDLAQVVTFPQNRDELFFCFPRAAWPLDIGQLAATMAERRESTVVELDGQLAGFANFFQWQYGEFCALGNLMVAPWARGRGVAQYLIGVMEEQARAHYQARLMKVSCFNGNAAGLLLYPRLGYQLAGVVERATPSCERVALIQFSKTL